MANGTSAFTSQTPLGVGHGGTGLSTTPGVGNLLIGNGGGTYTLAPLTGTVNKIAITNGPGGSSNISLAPPVLIATQPCFFCYLSGNITVATSTGTTPTTLGDTGGGGTFISTVNQGGHFNTGNGTFTAPVAGNYLLGAYVTFEGVANAQTVHSGYIVIILGGVGANQYIYRLDPQATIVDTTTIFTVSASVVTPLALNQSVGYNFSLTSGGTTDNATVSGWQFTSKNLCIWAIEMLVILTNFLLSKRLMRYIHGR